MEMISFHTVVTITINIPLLFCPLSLTSIDGKLWIYLEILTVDLPGDFLHKSNKYTS